MTHTAQSDTGTIRIHSVSVVVPLAWLRRACYRCYFIAKVVGNVRCEHR